MLSMRLFVGAPKVGKSFFMGQLAYHVAMGLPLWNYPVRKGTVLYLALEDDYSKVAFPLSEISKYTVSGQIRLLILDRAGHAPQYP